MPFGFKEDVKNQLPLHSPLETGALQMIKKYLLLFLHPAISDVSAGRYRVEAVLTGAFPSTARVDENHPIIISSQV